MTNISPTPFEHSSDPASANVLPVTAGSEQLDGREFLAFLEANCTPAMLIADRPAQGKLNHLLLAKFYTGARKQIVYANWSSRLEDMEEAGLLPNTAPHFLLKKESERGVFKKTVQDSFFLKETQPRQHHYYIPENHGGDVPTSHYLRAGDTVPCGVFDRIFTEQAKARACAELGTTPKELDMLREEEDPIIQPFKEPVERLYRGTLHRTPTLGGPEERFNYVQQAWESTGYQYDPGIRTRVAGRLRNAVQRFTRPSIELSQAQKEIE